MCIPRRLASWFACLAALFLAGALVLTGGSCSRNRTDQPERRGERFWVARHNRFRDFARQGGIEVLFLGDSLTEDWEGRGEEVWNKQFAPLRAANFGINGDRTQHLLWRITEGGELEGINPRVAVLLIGANNLDSNSAVEITQGIRAIVRELRRQRPEMRILLLGIFPCYPKASHPLRAKIWDVNERIAALGDGEQVRYLDIGDKFLGPDGSLDKEVVYDNIHLTSKGYAIWAEAIAPELSQLLAN